MFYEVLIVVDFLAFLYMLTKKRVKRVFTRFPFMFGMTIIFSLTQGYVVATGRGAEFSIGGFMVGLMVALPFSVIQEYIEGVVEDVEI